MLAAEKNEMDSVGKPWSFSGGRRIWVASSVFSGIDKNDGMLYLLDTLRLLFAYGKVCSWVHAPVLGSHESVLALPCEAVLRTVGPCRGVYTHTLEPAVPTGAITAKPTQHDHLAARFPQSWDPVIEEPHTPATGPVHDLIVHKLREHHGGGSCEVLLLD